MKAILLAAGKGKRFGEITKHVPKPLIKVGGKSLIQHTLEALPKQITECLVVIQHLGDQIVHFLETLQQPRKLSYCFQQFPGTGGALLSTKEQLKYDDFFLVVGTDDIFGVNDLESWMLSHASYGVIRKTPNKDRVREPIIDTEGYLVGFKPIENQEKPCLCGVGAFLLTPSIFNKNFIALSNGELSLPDTVAGAKIKAKAVLIKNWIPVNDLEELAIAERLIHQTKY